MSEFRYQVSICAMYKNEGIFLSEWIEYHLLLGFEHFYLYNNRSDDHHRQVLAPYIERGLITYHDYDLDFSSLPTSVFQADANYPYNHCPRQYAHESRWIGFIDLDEFIVIKTHKSIIDFMAIYEQYAGVAINWVCFGTSEHHFDPSGLVIENYVLRGPNTNSINSHVKSIINPRLWIKWLNPHLSVSKGHTVYYDYTVCNRAFGGRIDHSRCAIHHYITKSKWYYIFKKMGRVHDLKYLKTPIVNQNWKNPNDFKGIFYSDATRWEDNNHISNNCVEDRTLLNYAPIIREKIHMSGEVNLFQSIRLIDRGYLDIPAVRKYYEDNIGHFKHQSMAVIFHYWFIFDESDISKITTKSIDELMINCDLKKYDSPEFLNYLGKFISPPDESRYSPLVAVKFYIDYEMWLPPGFNWKYYVTKYPNLAHFNEFLAIEHWINYGRAEGLSGVPEIYTTVMSQYPEFDWEYYTMHYPDLSHFDEIRAMEHWVNHGKSEGRLCVPP